MKKGLRIGLIVGAIVLVLVIFVVSSYNGLVSAEVAVDNAASDIEVQLTRRADLVPNLVNTVKGYAAHEEDIYTALAEARAKLAGSTSTEETIQAGMELDAALSRLLVVVENYPDLKASANFQALQDELAGTENRIAVARKDYNAAVSTYNVKLRRFPTNIFANLFGFEARTMYEAPASDLETPTVDFSK